MNNKYKKHILCKSCEITKSLPKGERLGQYENADFKITDNTNSNLWLSGIMSHMDILKTSHYGYQFEINVNNSRYMIKFIRRNSKICILIQYNIHNEFGKIVLFNARYVRINL